MMQVTQLAPVIGAEIRGIDLERLDDEGFDALYRAFLQHQLLVIRDQSLSPAQQVALTQRFGEPDIHVLRQYNHPQHPEIFVLSNRKVDGKPLGIDDGGSYWHSDFAFKECPAKATLLNAQEIPPTGGTTHFANMYSAYDSLPDAWKTRLAGLSAIHRYRPSGRGNETTRVVLDETQRRETPDVTHPVVRTHPETGRQALFVHPGMTAEIAGLPAEESEQILSFLFAHSTSAAHTFEFVWRHGDVVIWDNRCTMHKATTRELPAHLHRTIFRTTVRGDRPY